MGSCLNTCAKADINGKDALYTARKALREIASHCTELANTKDVSVGDRRCYKSLAALANAALS